MTSTKWVSCVVVGALCVAGCGKKKDAEVEQLGRAKAPPAAAPAAPDAPQKKVYTGTIAEVIQVKEYTYLRLTDEKGASVWAAVPKDTFSVGDKVQVVSSIVMRDFHSKTLNRTFSSVVFGIVPGRKNELKKAEGALPAGHPPIGDKGAAAAPKDSAQGGTSDPTPDSGRQDTAADKATADKGA